MILSSILENDKFLWVQGPGVLSLREQQLKEPETIGNDPSLLHENLTLGMSFSALHLLF